MLQRATAALADGAQDAQMAAGPARDRFHVAPHCPDALLSVVDGLDSGDDELPGERCRGLSHAPLLGAPQPLTLAPAPATSAPAPGLLASGDAAMDSCLVVELSQESSSESESESDSSIGTDDEKDEDAEAEGHAVPVPRPCGGALLSREQVDAVICSDVEALEAKRPWCFVFRCLEVPFHFSRVHDPFDVFFLRWDVFWRTHGHAVWERAFWKPLRPDLRESHRRHRRQVRAMCAFRELAADLLARLGPAFRQRLARKLHDGWWYRTEPFGLRRLFQRSRRLYDEYLRRRMRERWPRGRKFLVLRSLQPVWWVDNSAAGVLDRWERPDKDDMEGAA